MFGQEDKDPKPSPKGHAESDYVETVADLIPRNPYEDFGFPSIEQGSLTSVMEPRIASLPSNQNDIETELRNLKENRDIYGNVRFKKGTIGEKFEIKGLGGFFGFN